MRNRNAMTILEVLFAILITAVGLLGAIAVFPVASEAARKGRINDMVTVASDGIAHKFDTMGMRRPDNWIAYVDGTATNQQATPFSGDVITAAPTFWKTSFCIDPRFTAQNIGAHAQNEQRWTYFPAFPKAGVLSPRMQRLTLKATFPPAANSPPMGIFQANHAFSIEDELAYERPGVQKGQDTPDDNASPAFQLYTGIKTQNGILPGKREEHGKLSWMATLCPKMEQFTGSFGNEYLLSTVTFYPRTTSLMTRDFNLPAPAAPFAEDVWPDDEWTVSIAGANFFSQGFGGGEVRMHADFAEKLKVRSGQWVMLAGNVGAKPIQNGTDPQGRPIMKPTELAQVFRWYKITEADEEVDTATINGTLYFVRDVTLVGGDWDVLDVIPFGNASSLPAGGDGILDDVEVTVMPGVVNVTERTVRLEGLFATP